MAQVIIYTNENGNVSVCYPTGELPIEEVLVKDCPEGAIIIDESSLPVDNEYFNAWDTQIVPLDVNTFADEPGPGTPEVCSTESGNVTPAVPLIMTDIVVP